MKFRLFRVNIKAVIKMDNKKPGELILKLRKEKGLTQNQLAELLSVSDKAVSKWERGIIYPFSPLPLTTDCK